MRSWVHRFQGAVLGFAVEIQGQVHFLPVEIGADGFGRVGAALVLEARRPQTLAGHLAAARQADFSLDEERINAGGGGDALQLVAAVAVFEGFRDRADLLALLGEAVGGADLVRGGGLRQAGPQAAQRG